ncbi:Aste57867_8824 [Aphanomyces stellatus]|uniref:Aste57867_8824 protein n=1 Tax=Aphanomyces stellatus TaxID=120398 RepID=A0A485KLK9_9STRA|nr:hypothetical protein As57867_008789 [Aphanomyces stellatus]VFT85710.1 Aste57867_8824 [Aphanomyces stellatus]
MKTIAFASTLALLATEVLGHGRLVTPPHRGWIGRVPGYSFVPIDYSDNGLNAGGVAATSNGDHGVCGDPFKDPAPRAHESGGFYGLYPNVTTRAVAACYAPGQTLNLTVQVTANHKGDFDFGVCKLNKASDVESEACFQPLAQPSGALLWPVPDGNLFFNMQYVLPKDLVCDTLGSHCVLRWHYAGGNNWGASYWGQEHFWNCADIYISNNCDAALTPTTGTPGTTAPSTAAPATTPTPPAPTTATLAPATPAPTPLPTTAVPVPSTAAPGDKCDGNHNTCYWPDVHQVLPYTKADCALFSTYVWCP